MRPVQTIFVAILSALLLPALPALAQPNLHEGSWEITTSMEMEGAPMVIPPQTRTQCMTQADLVPDAKQQGPSCKMLDQKMEGSTASWRMVCKTEQGSTEGAGRISYTGDSFQGEMTARVTDPNGKASNMKLKYQGRRIGPCQSR